MRRGRPAIRVLAAVLTGVAAAVLAQSTAATAQRTTTAPHRAHADYCGEVALPGSDWLGGQGVDVFSNGPDAGTGNSCGGTSYVNGIAAGQEWQCVELVDRLYLTEGWIDSTWYGNGADMYRLAPTGLAKQPQGEISFLSPGDVVSYESPGGVEPGHAGIVDTVTPSIDGGWDIQFVNQNGFLYTEGTLLGGRLTMSTPWVEPFPVVGVIHHPGAVPPPTEPANLLRNGSFERDVTTGWSTLDAPGGATTAVAMRSADVPQGGNLLQFGSDKAGGSVYQDVAEALAPGESYTFTTWVRDPSGRSGVCVVLVGMGASVEYGQTCESVGEAWTEISAPYDVSRSGLVTLRAQVILETPLHHLDLAGATLTSDQLRDASFERGQAAGWVVASPPGGTTEALAQKVTGAPEGGDMLQFSSSKAGASVYQNVTAELVPGQSYTFSAWLRDPGGRTTACVVLWGLGEYSSPEFGQTCTSVAATWMYVSAPFDVDGSGLGALRAQVYSRTAGQRLDVVGTSLVNDGLSEATFQGGRAAAWAVLAAPGGSTQALAYTNKPAPEGNSYLEFGSSKPGAAIAQDIHRALQPGQSFSFSAWVRDPAGTGTACLTVWGLGASSQYGRTCTTLGATWVRVAAPYDVSVPGLDDLRVEVTLENPAQRLDVAGSSLSAVR